MRLRPGIKWNYEPVEAKVPLGPTEAEEEEEDPPLLLLDAGAPRQWGTFGGPLRGNTGEERERESLPQTVGPTDGNNNREK